MSHINSLLKRFDYFSFYNAFIVHSYLPPTMKVILIPLVKSRLEDQSASSNYRLITVATAASKITVNGSFAKFTSLR